MALGQKTSSSKTSNLALENAGLYFPSTGLFAITGKKINDTAPLLKFAAEHFNDDKSRKFPFIKTQRKQVIYINNDTQLDGDTLGKAIRKSGLRPTDQRVEALFNDLGLKQLLQPFNAKEDEGGGEALHWTKRPTNSISPEERRRVAIAIAILTPNTAIFLNQHFDDPTPEFYETLTRETLNREKIEKETVKKEGIERRIINALIIKSRQKLIVISSRNFGTIYEKGIPGVFVRQGKVIEQWRNPKEIRGSSEFLYAVLNVPGYSVNPDVHDQLDKFPQPKIVNVSEEEINRLAQDGWFQVPANRQIDRRSSVLSNKSFSEKEIALGAAVILTTPRFCEALCFNPADVPAHLRKDVAKDLGELYCHINKSQTNFTSDIKNVMSFGLMLNSYVEDQYLTLVSQRLRTLCPTLFQVLCEQNNRDHVTFKNLSSDSTSQLIAKPEHVINRLTEEGWFPVPKNRRIRKFPEIHYSDEEITLGATVILATSRLCKALKFNPADVPAHLRKDVAKDLGELYWDFRGNGRPHDTTSRAVFALESQIISTFSTSINRQLFSHFYPTLFQMLSEQNNWGPASIKNLSPDSPYSGSQNFQGNPPGQQTTPGNGVSL